MTFMSWSGLAILALCLSVLGCAGGGADGPSDTAQRPAANVRPVTGAATVAPPAPPLAPVGPYEPAAGEVYPNAKRFAASIAQTLATYDTGASALRIAEAVPGLAQRAATTATVIAPLVDSRSASTGEVVYVQLSGVTPSTLGAMVIMRQRLRPDAGPIRTVTRTLDVRLQRSTGPWQLERVASAGGQPQARPSTLAPTTEAVLDHPNIDLPDSARWDLYRARVDPALLTALLSVAETHRIAIATFRNGHPTHVWATARRSAHSVGQAADIYAVDDRDVVLQRRPGSAAQRVASALLAGGAHQVGSPWPLGPPPRSFTDVVHQDHLHVQQRATWTPAP